MATDQPTLPIQHEQPAGTGHGVFFIEKDGERLARMTYRQQDDTVTIQHTEVSDALRGQGAGKRLLEAAGPVGPTGPPAGRPPLPVRPRHLRQAPRAAGRAGPGRHTLREPGPGLYLPSRRREYLNVCLPCWNLGNWTLWAACSRHMATSVPAS